MRNIVGFVLLVLIVPMETCFATQLINLNDVDVEEGEQVKFTVGVTKGDYYEPEDLVFNFYTKPGSSYDSLPYGHNAVLSYSGDLTEREFSWTPEIGWDGVYDIRFTVSDGKYSDYHDVRIDVNGEDHEPVMYDIDDKILVIGDELSFMLPYEHVDIHDTQTFRGYQGWLSNWGSYRAESSMPDNAEIHETLGYFKWIPNEDDNRLGDYKMTFCVRDDGNHEDCSKMTIILTDNYYPELRVKPSGLQQIAVGKELIILLDGIDVEDGENIDYSAVLYDEDEGEEFELPSGAEVGDHQFSWIPIEGQEGDYVVRLRVEDRSGNEDFVDVNVTVLEADEVGGEVVDDSNGEVDVEDWDIVYGDSVSFMVGEELFEGDEDTGSLALDRIVNRAEAMKILLEAFDHAMQKSFGIDGFGFKDLRANEWYMDYIYTAYNSGIMIGYGDSTMRPEDDVSRAEFMKMMVKVLGEDVDEALDLIDSEITEAPKVVQFKK